MTEQPTQSAALDAAKTGAQIHAQMFSSALSRISSHASSCAVHNEPAMPAGPCDCSVEAEIQAKGKTAARVTPDDIQREIVEETYFTAAEGRHGHSHKNHGFEYAEPANSPLNLLTFCVLELRNGFTVTGESACASPENFDAEIGRRIARENAVQKIRPLLGFRLRDRLAASA